MKFERLFDPSLLPLIITVPYFYSMDKSSQSDFAIVNIHITFPELSLLLYLLKYFTYLFNQKMSNESCGMQNMWIQYTPDYTGTYPICILCMHHFRGNLQCCGVPIKFTQSFHQYYVYEMTCKLVDGLSWSTILGTIHRIVKPFQFAFKSDNIHDPFTWRITCTSVSILRVTW
jgi:hypothetical protein